MKITGGHFEESADFVQSLSRGLSVIRAFRGEPALTLSEVAGRAELSRAVARRLLLTLVHLGYASQTGRLFSLSPRVLELGYSWLSARSMVELAHPYMEALMQELKASCVMTVLDGRDIVYVQRAPARRMLAMNVGIGSRLPAYCTSMGRVLLSGLSDAALDDWLVGLEAPARTRYTLTSRTAIRDAVRAARANGYAYMEQEFELGICSIAVPVHNRTGAIVAAISVGLFMSDDAHALAHEQILPRLKRAASEIDLALAGAS